MQDSYEFKNSFYDDVKSAFVRMGRLGEFKEALTLILNSYYEITSVRDFVYHEEGIKAYMLSLMNMDPCHMIQSEVELDRGHADIYLNSNLENFSFTKYDYLIELKYIGSDKKVSKKLLNQKEEEALNELNMYSEDKVIKQSINNGKILKRLIIVLSSKKVEVLKEV